MVVRLLWQAIVTRTSRFGNAHIHPTTCLSCSLLPKLRSAGAREVLKPFCLLCLCCPFPASPDWEILTSVQPLLSGLLQLSCILFVVVDPLTVHSSRLWAPFPNERGWRCGISLICLLVQHHRTMSGHPGL